MIWTFCIESKAWVVDIKYVFSRICERCSICKLQKRLETPQVGFFLFENKWLMHVSMYDKKETKSTTHYMNDQKLFHGDMKKVSQDILILLHEKLHT